MNEAQLTRCTWYPSFICKCATLNNEKFVVSHEGINSIIYNVYRVNVLLTLFKCTCSFCFPVCMPHSHVNFNINLDFISPNCDIGTWLHFIWNAPSLVEICMTKLNPLGSQFLVRMFEKQFVLVVKIILCDWINFLTLLPLFSS